MWRTIGGPALLVLAAFMFAGFLRSDASLSAPTVLVAVLITVLVPGAAGVALTARRLRAGPRRNDRREALRRQTLDSEILRLASRNGGRLTLVDVVQDMAVPTEEAQGALEGLVHREIADLAVTDSGTLVYTFRDIERRDETGRARHILE